MSWFAPGSLARWPLPASALAAGSAVLIAATFCGSARSATETRRVADFDQVVISVPGEVSINQGPAETLTLEAEPAVLRKITTEIVGRRLLIGLVPGRVETQQPIRMKLGVRNLRAFESRTAGAITVGALGSDSLALVLTGGSVLNLDRLDRALSLDVRITGAGEVAVGGGTVVAQKVAITGAGTYAAPRLASERAEVAIDGHGEVQLAASTTLAVRIGGVGRVRYRGNPAVTRSIRGVGSIEKD